MGTITPTATQITLLRDDFASGQANFTDAQITALWGQAVNAVDETTQHDATLYLMIRREIGRLAEGSMDYSTGNTSEKLSQRIDNLRKIMALYQPAYDRISTYSSTIAIGSLRNARPPAEKPIGDEPIPPPTVWQP